MLKQNKSRIGEFIKRTDKLYLLFCIACSAISSVTLLSWCKYASSNGSYRVFYVQVAASAVGIVCALIISTVDYRLMARLWPLHASATWFLVLLTFIRKGPFGASNGTDNYSWIKLPLGLSIQPTELAKISFILTFALHLSNVKEKINEPKVLIKLILHWLAPVALIHFQGDDGTALIFLVIGAVMLFSAGLSYKYILSVFGAALISIPLWFPFLWGRMGDYQRNRILGLLNPEDATYRAILYQQNMARISIGAGEITGRGLFSSEHHYVPENQNDFIFSYISEAMGFVGSMLVIILLCCIIAKTFTTAMKSQDVIGSYICVGVAAVFITQMVLNLGMNLYLLPVIGITLPFFSAGGTSVTMLYLSVGVVLSVYAHNKKTIFLD